MVSLSTLRSETGSRLSNKTIPIINPLVKNPNWPSEYCRHIPSLYYCNFALEKESISKAFLKGERERERENQRDVYDLYMNRGEGRGSFTFDTSVCT